MRHLDHDKDQPCSLCEAEAAAKQDGSALLNMLRGPKELVRDDERTTVVRIPGTSITISRRKP